MASTSRIPSQRGFDSWITLVQCFLLQYSMVPTTRRVIMQKRNLYMCVGFALDHSRAVATKGFKIVCILEIHTTYTFEISDGNSWRFSETIITTTSSKMIVANRRQPLPTTKAAFAGGSGKTSRPLSGHMGRPWITQQIMVLFGYGLIWTWFYLGFDQKCATPSSSVGPPLVYTLTGDHTSKWALARQIENVLMTEREFEYWNVVAYDGKHMVVKDKKKDTSTGVARVYNMEDNSWGAWWETLCQAKYNLDLFRFTPFFSFFEHTEVVEDSTNLARIMRLINPTKQINKFLFVSALAYDK
ncbi:hypothetical protein YC2023_096734 [Brassica napus]